MLNFSIIVPVYKEKHTILPLLDSVKNTFKNASFETIVVDGSPDQDTLGVINDPEIIKIPSEKGRANQMNKGSEVAKGEILLFLHADTSLPENAPQTIKEALKDPEIKVGAFTLKINTKSPLLKFVAWGSSLRSKITRVPYGDQAIFIRKDYFEELGRYNSIPIMEEVDLMCRIRKNKGKITILKESVLTSARRWEEEGIIRGTLRNLMLFGLYYCGVSPNKLIHFYKIVPGNQTAIILFIKYPEKGKVKTRLAKELREEFVVLLYRSFVKDLLTTLSKINFKLRVYFSSEKPKKYFKNWLGSNLQFFPQKGKDLGKRMKNAFEETFEKNFKKVLIVGSDSPDLPMEILEGAEKALDKNDLVIGPTFDGGYYLLGFTKEGFRPEIFDEIEWSSQYVFSKTLAKTQSLKLTYYQLPEWLDIDEFSDLKDFYKRNQNSQFKESKTMKLLAEEALDRLT